MRKHIESEHLRIRYACEFEAKSPQQLKYHVETKHVGKKFNCDICEFQSTSKSDFRQHIEAEHKELKYKCKMNVSLLLLKKEN